MSTQAQFPASPQMKKEEAERRKEIAARRSDLLYFTGATVFTAGVAQFSLRAGCVAAGCFLLLLPMLEIVSSFVKGMRIGPKGR